MNGPHTYTDGHQPARRTFLKQIASLFAVPFAVSPIAACNTSTDNRHITGSMAGANAATGHLLRTGNFPAATKTLDTEILIVGGGATGLSAKRWLEQHGQNNVLLLELDKQPGGNSVAGANSVSAYPWGAHYMTLPDTTNTDLISFLRSAGIITSFDSNGLPVYNEYYLCHDPEERLYINGHWQEGLVPRFGTGSTDRLQTERFLKETERLKHAVGNDGQPCFAIPLDTSSADEEYRRLDNITFDQYLTENGYTSRYLRWYLEYCCKDDYGSTLHQTSAWAGLHYFASRKGRAANALSSAVLTWPEGNAFLINALKHQAPDNVRTNMLVHNLELTAGGVLVQCYNAASRSCTTIRARKVLLCTPQYITKRIVGTLQYPASAPSYAPWVVANVTLDRFPASSGFPLCWDNVIYGQESVGYVNARHQNLGHLPGSVVTYYLPVTGDDTLASRRSIRELPYTHWRDRVVQDLEFAHPGIRHRITNIDVWIWGHGMVRPSPGYIWSNARQAARQPIDNRVFFAHTDLSGISVFEEAFFQGVEAAKKILQTS